MLCASLRYPLSPYTKATPLQLRSHQDDDLGFAQSRLLPYFLEGYSVGPSSPNHPTVRAKNRLGLFDSCYWRAALRPDHKIMHNPITLRHAIGFRGRVAIEQSCGLQP